MNKPPEALADWKTSCPKVHHLSHQIFTVIHRDKGLSTAFLLCGYANMRRCEWREIFRTDEVCYVKRRTAFRLHLYYIYVVEFFFPDIYPVLVSNPHIYTSAYPHILLPYSHPYIYILSFCLPNPPKSAPDSGFPHFVYNSFCPIFAIL